MGAREVLNEGRNSISVKVDNEETRFSEQIGNLNGNKQKEFI
jgi:hypothetical protein